MQQECRQCSAVFEIIEDDLAFYGKISPRINDKTYAIPPPTLCPDCRLQRRLMYRNDRNFYKRRSDKSGREIVTLYSPDKPYTIYDKDEWWSDEWDPRAYGRDIDFSRPFFEQFHELRLLVPRASLFTSNSENSYYTNHALNMKNCYLIWGGGEDVDCMYGNFLAFCKNTVDSFSLFSCEHCYEGIAADPCFECIGFLNCSDCQSSTAIEECSSCAFCIGCYGLHRRQYCLFNRQLSKEEWLQRKSELGSLTLEKISLLQQQLEALKKGMPRRGSHIYASENCTGDSIYNSKNCRYCFDIKDCEACMFTAFTPGGISTYDSTFTAPTGVEKCYFVCSSLGHGLLFTFLAYNCNFTLYSQECHYCNNIFGCASMRHHEYCILNKQYSKEEYEKTMGKLIEHMQETGEWGEYFPPKYAPITYNESNGIDFFPLTKEEVEEKGWQWRDPDPPAEEGTLITRIPETIGEVDESITKGLIRCEVSGKPFKILPQELSFYRTMQLPIPRKHPITRHEDRLMWRCPRRLWKKKCMKCGKEMQTTYSPERPEIVYCESCYLAEVY